MSERAVIVWLRSIEYTGGNIGTGKVSMGCSTVTAREKWDEIYRFLINRRLDEQSVATLRVENN